MNMKKKFVECIAVLLVVAMFSGAAFAAERVVESLEDGKYIIKTNDRGVFWIEDNVHHRTLQLTAEPVRVKGRPQSGIFDVICGDQARRIVNDATTLSILLQKTLRGKIAVWIGRTIYNELCNLRQ